MATHSSILAWRIPYTEEPGRLQSIGSQESDTTWQLNHHHHHLQDRVQSPVNTLQTVAWTTSFPPIPSLPFNKRTLELQQSSWLSNYRPHFPVSLATWRVHVIEFSPMGCMCFSHSFKRKVYIFPGFPAGSDGKESLCNVGDLGSIPGLGRSSGEGNGNPLQYSCLENPHGERSLAGYSVT